MGCVVKVDNNNNQLLLTVTYAMKVSQLNSVVVKVSVLLCHTVYYRMLLVIIIIIIQQQFLDIYLLKLIVVTSSLCNIDNYIFIDGWYVVIVPLGRSRSNSVDSSSSFRRQSSNSLSKKPPLRRASSLTIKV